MGGLPPIFFVLFLSDAIQQLACLGHLLYLLLVGWIGRDFGYLLEVINGLKEHGLPVLGGDGRCDHVVPCFREGHFFF